MIKSQADIHLSTPQYTKLIWMAQCMKPMTQFMPHATTHILHRYLTRYSIHSIHI